MVSALVLGSSGVEWSGFGLEWSGHCVVFLGKTLYSHSAFLRPGAYICTGEFMFGSSPAVD